ncbi:LOW QUALITY PROTEIN: putative mediator of RNA polymerase II transcription subunit 29 [Drosophila busckii]|uniref:LOW QUALITY PROTEIN: putative mediator of RNA polymerase II transcription subunit 29 n=1 Tax=Drosophila busckii TaxID=30019 RepID=UPI0014334336|nr:LOW QUALITY PROTEIN: putative mediator of RNA polymerase II transcription subunit 29 [Drosophila busckii]
MQLKAPKSRNMASLKDDETPTNNRHSSSSSNNTTTTILASTSSSSNNNNTKIRGCRCKRESLRQRNQALEQRLSEKSWLLQQIQKQETAIMHGNYEHLTVNEFFAQLAQQYKHEQQLQALAKDTALLRRKQSTSSSQSHNNNNSSNNNNNNSNSNNNRLSETQSNRSSEYDNYQPTSSNVGDMLVIGVAQQQSQQQPHVKSALKKRPTPTPTTQMQLRQQQHLQHQQQQQQLYAQQHANYLQQLQQQDVISMYSANSSNVATLRQQHVSPQQQPIIVQCDKYYLSPTHQSYNEGGFIKSSQNIKQYVSPLASPSALSYEQSSLQHQQHQRQLDAISLAPSYISVELESVQQQQQQQYRWRSQSHIAALTPPHAMPQQSHSSDMLAAPLPRYGSKPKPLDEISLLSEKKPKPKQWLESSLDGPAVVRQLDNSSTSAHSPASSSNGSGAAAAAKPRPKLSSQSMSVSGRHYSMSAQRSTPHNYVHSGYAAVSSSKLLQQADERYAKLSQSTSYLNAMEQSVGISASYALEPLDIPPFRNLPPKPNQSQQPTPPPRPPPANKDNFNNNNIGGISHALVSPPLAVATATAAASLSPEIRIESPKNMTVVQQATFQPYKEVTKPFEMSDFYKYSTKFKQKEAGRPE